MEGLAEWEGVNIFKSSFPARDGMELLSNICDSHHMFIVGRFEWIYVLGECNWKMCVGSGKANDVETTSFGGL